MALPLFVLFFFFSNVLFGLSASCYSTAFRALPPRLWFYVRPISSCCIMLLYKSSYFFLFGITFFIRDDLTGSSSPRGWCSVISFGESSPWGGDMEARGGAT